jgi:hypothetical protein
MTVVAGMLVALGALFCICLALLIWAKPAQASRFLLSFASSARAHFTEQTARLIFGVALVARAPVMRYSSAFQVIGWAVVISTLALIVMPWRWHHRLGEAGLPVLVRHMKLYAIGSLLFGVVLIHALFRPIA